MKALELQMTQKQFTSWRKSLQRRSTLAIIITAAVLIETTAVVQYLFARKGIREEVQHRAQSELHAKSLEIRNLMVEVETAVKNTAWVFEQNFQRPDSLVGICEHLLQNTSTLIGCGLGFEANYYPQYGKWFEPYAIRQADGRFGRSQIGSATHDYLHSEWYIKAKEKDGGYWTEPYYDEAGARMMLCTYALPLHDSSGRTVAVIGADVSLDWLSQVINSKQIYPSSYNLMISREGQIMACPIESLVLKTNIQQATAKMKDTSVNTLNQNMLSGQRGQTVVTDDKGEKNYVFYAPVEGETGWSMAVVCSDHEIYYGLRQVGFNLLLLMLVGLALLGYIIARTVRGFNRLQEVNATKVSMENELNIASHIQMAMLPKIFPPYPDRQDIDIYGLQKPAKAVGGDIYDFYIRDEKLFFCIGDVSGKGVPSSLVMAVTRTLFRVVSGHEAAPERIVTQINETISEGNESNMFVTLFVGVLDLPTGRLRYCNAGHDAPLLVGNGVESLPCVSNIPVGIMADWKYQPQETLVLPQTTIFLYTDGLTEAEDASHGQFGLQRVLDRTQQAWRANEQAPTLLLNNMNRAVSEFVDDAEQSDDLTMLAIQYTKQQQEVRLRKALTLPNDVKTIPQLAAFVDDICEALGFDMSTTMQMNLALEEAVVNVMSYAYPAGTKGDVHIEAQANDERLKFTITDSGAPFDPTAKDEIDTTLSAEDRPIGGLGIFLVREMMDSINYERVDGQNVLTLRKKLKATVKS